MTPINGVKQLETFILRSCNSLTMEEAALQIVTAKSKHYSVGKTRKKTLNVPKNIDKKHMTHQITNGEDFMSFVLLCNDAECTNWHL